MIVEHSLADLGKPIRIQEGLHVPGIPEGEAPGQDLEIGIKRGKPGEDVAEGLDGASDHLVGHLRCGAERLARDVIDLDLAARAFFQIRRKVLVHAVGDRSDGVRVHQHQGFRGDRRGGGQGDRSRQKC